MNPAFPLVPGCTSKLRNPAAVDHDNTAAPSQQRLSKIKKALGAQRPQFIGSAKADRQRLVNPLADVR
ncbi:MAG: hypothetical protein L0Z50_24515, partial [Verrucomicrobiales bacterium]|nr:hypothetical protein [Verrucomicrobiales bacterium]